MKNLILLLAAAVVLFTGSCKKDTDDNNNDDNNNNQEQPLNPLQVQWGLVINQTATWCGSCGGWGAPLLHELAVMNSNKVLSIAPHSSNDPMHNSALYNSVGSDRKTGGGIPSFWVGDEKASSSNASSKMTTLISRTPMAGIDMKTTKNADNFNVKARLKFFTAGQGDYYLSFFILEDGINGNSGAGNYAQSGTSNANFKHDFVLRACHTTGFYGEKIATDPAANAVFDKDFNFTFNTAWTNTLYVGAAVWHYNPNGDPSNFIPKYEFINGFVKK